MLLMRVIHENEFERPPCQALGLVREEGRHVDRHHLSHAGCQQVMQLHELYHLVAQLEQVAAVPLPDAADLQAGVLGDKHQLYSTCTQDSHQICLSENDAHLCLELAVYQVAGHKQEQQAPTCNLL